MNLKLEIPESFLKDTSAEIIVPQSTKELWAVQLDLLDEIDSICRKHGIRYSIDSGTLIGAMRHGGFIPWDDDVDVVMLREDYIKFSECVNNEISGEYFFQNWENSPGYYRSFGRLLNIKTSAISKADFVGGKSKWNYPQCVFVDILVVDNIPDGDEERAAHFKRLKTLHRRYWTARSCVARFKNLWRIKMVLSDVHRVAAGALLRFLEILGLNLTDKWFTQFNRELQRYNNTKTAYGAPYTNRPYEIIAVNEFDNLIDVDFEFLKVRAFGNYDSILTQQYGNWRRHVVGARTPIVYDIQGVLN